jgi:hypothetical protein
MLTERDVQIVRAVIAYYVLTRSQIQRLFFPAGESARRHLCKRMNELVAGQYVFFTELHAMTGVRVPVYYPAPKGAELCREYFDDEHYLTTVTRRPQTTWLQHWVAISDTHILLDQALAKQQAVTMLRWFSEWDVVNKDQTLADPRTRFTLYTEVEKEPRVVCTPDAGFLLELGKHRRAFFLEQDRNTDSAPHYVAKKVKGYAGMLQKQLHKKIFPDTTMDDFGVLMISPDERRRKALCEAMKGQPGERLWKFASVDKLTTDNVLHEPHFYPPEGEAVPLVRPEAIPGGTPAGSPGGGSPDASVVVGQTP